MNVLCLVVFSAHFLCSFFLLNAFLIPPTHKWVAMRMILWACIGGMGFREAYIDMETWGKPLRKENPVPGRYRWLCVSVIITESLLCMKYIAGTNFITDAPTPLYISVPWTVGAIGLAVGAFYLRFKPGRTIKYPGCYDTIENEQRSPRRSPRKHSPTKKYKL